MVLTYSALLRLPHQQIRYNLIPPSPSCCCISTLNSTQNALNIEMTKTPHIADRQRLLSPVVLAFVLYNLLSFATLLLEVPLVRLFEKSICNRYYRQQHPQNPTVAFQDIDESLCKGAPVQNLLATVVGWELSFSAVPGLLTAIYYGYLAEKRGRRLVLFLSVLGHIGMNAWVVVIC
jgi:hypothetical protein